MKTMVILVITTTLSSSLAVLFFPAASMLRPYISEKNYWIFVDHEIFQAYYYGDAMNVNKNIRDRFKDNDHFKACETFCER